MERIHSVVGIVGLLAAAFVFCESRRDVQWRFVVSGVALQFAVALVVLRIPLVRDVIFSFSNLALVIQDASEEGSAFMFGFLGGGGLPYEETGSASSFIMAFRVLPMVIVVSALSSLLFYWGVLPFLIRLFARVLERSMRVSGAVGFSAAASVFLGTIETPLVIRPYLASLSRGELLAMMTCVMATVAGTVMVIFATLLEPIVPGALGHILVASVVSVPAALVTSHLVCPVLASQNAVVLDTKDEAVNSVDAIMRGTQQGIRIALEIAATIIVLLAIVGLINRAIGIIPIPGDTPLSLQTIFGTLLRPLIWCMGIPWSETAVAGTFMGTKTVLNEFIAYVDFAQADGSGLSERSRVILTYALCGFANFGSMGIVVGGMNAILPERRDELVALGFRAIWTGTLATMMTGAVIGVLL